MVIDLLAQGHDSVHYLAQAVNVSPEAPPGAGGFLRLLRWLMWGVVLAGVAAIIYAGGKFGWERYNGGTLESPKIVVGALVGGALAASAGTLINTVMIPG